MALHIILEVALALVIFFVGTMWWQLLKRDAFLKWAFNNRAFLEGFISQDLVLHPPPRVVACTEIGHDEVGRLHFMMLIGALGKTDSRLQRRIKWGHAAVLLLALVGSHFLGDVYLAMNGILLALLGLQSISVSARNNALEQVLTIAVILHKWIIENPSECAEWIQQAWSLRTLYDVVRASK